MVAVLAAFALIVLLTVAAFAVPAVACQAVAAKLGSPIGVVVSGVAGLSVLVVFALRGWAGCTADPAWVPREDLTEGGYYASPCDGPAGMIIHVFLMFGAPMAALMMLVATTWMYRRAGRDPA